MTDPSQWSRITMDQLLDRRLIIAAGALDDAAATEICAALMTLDGRSAERVDIRLSASGGPIGAAMTLADTIDAMRAPVTTIATGGVTGPAIVVLAVSDHSVVTPTTSITIALDRADLGAATATGARIAADAARHQLDAFTCRLAAATLPSADEWRDRFERGAVIAPDEALALGLAERVGFR